MGLDCGSWIAKYVLCLFNFIFFLASTLTLGVGVWLRVDKDSFVSILRMVENEHITQFTQPAVMEQSAYALIALGAFMFFLSFLGYCGAIRESQCLLTTYGIFLLLILLAEIAGGCFIFVYKDNAKTETKQFLQTTVTKYYSSSDRADAVTLMWNHLMAEMSCCGVTNYEDFNLSENWVQYKGNRTIPEACCVLTSEKTFSSPRDSNCPQSPTEKNSYFMKGCYDTVLDYITMHRNIVIGVVVGLICFQLFAIFLAFCLS